MRLLLLILHVLAGSIGLLTGTLAMVVRKGGNLHRASGNVFTVAMLTLATSAFCLAILKSQQGNVVGSVGTFYLIGTAWLAGRRGERTRLIDWSALFIGLVGAVAAIALGIYTLLNPGGVDKTTAPAGMSFFFGAILLLASRRGHSNARTRRNFRPAAYHSASVAHVLRSLHRDRLFLPGSTASFPGLPARLSFPDHTCTSAATSADLLVPPRALQQGSQEPDLAQPATGGPFMTDELRSPFLIEKMPVGRAIPSAGVALPR